MRFRLLARRVAAPALGLALAATVAACSSSSTSSAASPPSSAASAPSSAAPSSPGTGSTADAAAQIKAKGWTLDREPSETPWGDWAFAVSDPDGFKITVIQE